MHPKIRLAVLLSLTSLLLYGCAAVPQWQREHLSNPIMQFEPPEAKNRFNHQWEYREGATGAKGSPGGGCGCD